MSVTISLLEKACDQLDLKYISVDESGVFLEIFFSGGRSRLFIANNLGLNSEVVEKICRDKSYSHALLGEYIRMPQTDTYIDPDPPDIYASFKAFDSTDVVVEDIIKKCGEKSLSEFPLLLKPNSGSMGINAFKCKSDSDVARAVNTIFDKNSYKYDHVLLVQEYIKIQKEYRVLVYNHTIQFVYQKDNTQTSAEFIGNISPLHYANAKAVLVADAAFILQLQEFIAPIFDCMDLQYAGLDIAVDQVGKMYLLEINSKPGFSYFVKDVGEAEVITLFRKILTDFDNKNS